jgi:hypothetical protein
LLYVRRLSEWKNDGRPNDVGADRMTHTISFINEDGATAEFQTEADNMRQALAEARGSLAAIPGEHAWRVTSFIPVPDTIPEPAEPTEPTPVEEQES